MVAREVRSWVLLASFVVGCADVAPRVAPVVYGADDRTDLYAVSDPLLARRAAESAAVMIDATLPDERDPSRVRVLGPTLRDDEMLCAGASPISPPPARARAR